MKKRWLCTALVLALLLLVPGRQAAAGSAVIGGGNSEITGYPSVGTPDPDESNDKLRNNRETFVIGESAFNGVFNPLFYRTAPDGTVCSLINAYLINTNAKAEPVAGGQYNSVAQSYEVYFTNDLNTYTKKSTYEEGDYVIYDFVLKHGAKFSDGSSITAEDVLFSFYVQLDPAFMGSSSLAFLPIRGLEAYQTQIADDDFRNGIYSKISMILNTGRTGYLQNSNYTREEYNLYWDCIDEAGILFVEDIVNYCCNNYPQYDNWDLDLSLEGNRIAFGMYLWGFGNFSDDGSFISVSDEYYNMVERFPTYEDFWDTMQNSYIEDNGFIDYIRIDSTEAADIGLLITAQKFFLAAFADEGSVQNIAGLMAGTVKINNLDYERVRVVLTGQDPSAILYLTVPVLPKAYYTAGYQYASGALVNAGVPWGLKNDSFMWYLRQFDMNPMGAGPYRFVSYENGAVTLVRNDYHYTMGDESVTNARIKNVKVDGNLGSNLNALTSGSVHLTSIGATWSVIDEVNARAELSSIMVDYNGYGYIWLNPKAGQTGGFAFDNLHARIALAAALKTSEALNYYADGASELLYRSISKNSWAYPEGAEPIYPFDESLETTIRELKLAGYTYNETRGRFTDVPAIDFYLPSEVDDHPAGGIYLATQELLSRIGVTVNIVVDRELMASEDVIPVFAMAWQSSAEPDLSHYSYRYDWYEYRGIPWLHQNGADESLGTLQVKKLDGSTVTMNQREALEYVDYLNELGRTYMSVAERKPIYEKALEVLAQLAIEIPTYQRKNMYVFNNTVLAASTLPAEITAYSSPLSEVWKLSLVSTKAGWRNDDAGWWYVREDGTYPVNQWEKIDGKWYHFDSRGYMQTGWLKLNGKWYYLAPGGAMQIGWQKVDGQWYYMDASGVMQTGWQKISGKWYYFNASGIMKTGWVKVDGLWYYLNSSGIMQTGWKKIDGQWYYLNSSGVMQTGWQEIGGKTYFFKSSGVMAAKEWCGGYYLNADGTWTYKYKASWKQNSKGWWYGDTSGWYAKSCTIKIDDKNYTFDANGYMQ